MNLQEDIQKLCAILKLDPTKQQDPGEIIMHIQIALGVVASAR